MLPPKGNTEYLCLSIVLIDSVYKIGEKCYAHEFLAECKYVVKQLKTYVTNKIEYNPMNLRNLCILIKKTSRLIY